jgi:hypothetical protein
LQPYILTPGWAVHEDGGWLSLFLKFGGLTVIFDMTEDEACRVVEDYHYQMGGGKDPAGGRWLMLPWNGPSLMLPPDVQVQMGREDAAEIVRAIKDEMGDGPRLPDPANWKPADVEFLKELDELNKEDEQ